MKIGRYYIRRASYLRNKLEDFYSVRNKKSEYYYTTMGFYQSRIFGLCIYRDAESYVKLMKSFKEKNEKK